MKFSDFRCLAQIVALTFGVGGMAIMPVAAQTGSPPPPRSPEGICAKKLGGEYKWDRRMWIGPPGTSRQVYECAALIRAKQQR